MNQTYNEMASKPVFPLLMKMAIPPMISMLIQSLYNIVDSIYVSMLSENALTAVSMAFPVQNMMIALGAGIGVGTNAILSRSLGENNQRAADETAMQGILLSLVSFVAFLVFGIFGAEAFMRSQTSITESYEGGTSYIRICR